MDLCSLHSETSPLDYRPGSVDMMAEKEHGCSMGTAEIHGFYIHGKCGQLWSMQEDKTRLVHFTWITLGVLVTNLGLRAAWRPGSYLPDLCFASSSDSLTSPCPVLSAVPSTCQCGFPAHLPARHAFPMQPTGSYCPCWTCPRAPSKMQSVIH